MTKAVGSVVAVVLAGGQGRRMGFVDKPLLPLSGYSLLHHVLQRLDGQCDAIAINANGDKTRFAEFQLPVISDSAGDDLGPLSGVLAGLDWAAESHPAATHLLTTAGDAPFIPFDLALRLKSGLNHHKTTYARACSFGRRHPVVGLWPIDIRANLRDALVNQGVRKIDFFTGDDVADVDFAGIPDPFFNVNTPEDRDEAERILRI